MKLKVIYLNLWEGGLLMPAVIDFLRQESPQIVCLQEVYGGVDVKLEERFRSIPVLKSALGYKYHHFAGAMIDRRWSQPLEEGNLILSNFPLDNPQVIFFDVPFGERVDDENFDYSYTPRNLQLVEATVNNQVFNILNVQGIWGFDGYDNERRLKMAQTIVDCLSNKANVILGGDFNIDINTQAIRNIETKLTNVFKGELKSSFNMLRKDNPGYATAVVDMIFMSPNLKIANHYCPAVDISDHLPLVLELDIA